ncbi:MAG: type I secretion system permease/ATPase [Pseudomonadota bacterium]
MNERIKEPDSTAAEQVVMSLAKESVVTEDNLLASLAYFCSHHGLPFSKERAIRGIATDGYGLSAKNYKSAAENLGLKVKFVESLPSRIGELVFPYLIFFKEGSAGVVRSKSVGGRLEITEFYREGLQRQRSLSTKECDRETFPFVSLVTVMPEETEPNLSDRQKPKHWFWSDVRRFWPSWSYVVFATFFINLLGLALPLFVMNVYDRVIPNNAIPTLWALVAGISIALGFDLLLKVLRSAVIDNSGKRIDISASSRIFEHALDVKMGSQPARSGETANHIREFESVREFFSSGAIASLIDLLFIGVFLGFLWFIVGDLVLVPLIAVPLVLLVALIVQFPLGKSVKASQAASGSRHSVLIESLVGIEAVKSVSAEGVLQKRWEQSVAAAARAGAATRFWSSLAVYFTMFAQQAVSVVVIAWGVFLVAAGDITIGALVAANILAGRILAPLGGIAGTLVRAQQSFSSMANLNKLMKLERDNPKTRGKGTNIESGAVEFRTVEFSYPDQLSSALNGVSLKITPGERVGIIGRVGSGKSTVGKLISGLYQPVEGGVLVDGTDTRHLDLAKLRRHAMYVGQETELFTGTIRENVRLSEYCEDGRLEAAFIGSGVRAFASKHPLGLEMPVGERGRLLSGGERQAVGIARAMAMDPKIMFLDEPTAHMDTVTEAAFVKSFGNWMSPSTTLIVATHRNTLLALVDRLIVVEDGKVLVDGPKDQVLKSIPQLRSKTAAKSGGGHARH